MIDTIIKSRNIIILGIIANVVGAEVYYTRHTHTFLRSEMTTTILRANQPPYHLIVVHGH